MKRRIIPRDISWLSFNSRVLQEAADRTVPLKERIRFLGIFSNNLDEFFRVRVATLKRMAELGSKISNMHLEQSPELILDEIQQIVLQQQAVFNTIWEEIRLAMEKKGVFLKNETQLNDAQQNFVREYFEEEARSYIIPLMIESIPQLPYLREKSIYLGVVLAGKDSLQTRKYSIIEVPTHSLGRFIKLPSPEGQQHIMLLEDMIRFNLPKIFSYFGYSAHNAWIFKVTKDAEMDIDNDVSTSFIQKIEKGLKNRRKGKAVRFIYDKEMDVGLLDFLMRKLHLTHRDSIIPGARIHNFRHFMDFPDVIPAKNSRKKPFIHPLLKDARRVTDIILTKDIMLSFPYHSFDAVIDLLREAAIDPDVKEIKITAYRLAAHSKVVNALVNAVRNGKSVTVIIELRARFDEEANLEWKKTLEEEGVKVLIGIPNVKIHAKICMIKKRVNKHTVHYGFVSTGNFNEKTARTYGDHCLLTSDRHIMADVNRMFTYIEKWKGSFTNLKTFRSLIPCPEMLRKELEKLINKEIRLAQEGKEGFILLKMNSLSDELLIEKLYEAAKAGVKLRLIIRGIFCMLVENKKFAEPVKALSIVDEYLEHARVFIFGNGGKGHEKVYISSADWMVRNLDHRVEITCPVKDPDIKKVLRTILDIQLNDNVKARVLNNELSNSYVSDDSAKIRSQVEIYRYLHRQHPGMETKPVKGQKNLKSSDETRSN